MRLILIIETCDAFRPCPLCLFIMTDNGLRTIKELIHYTLDTFDSGQDLALLDRIDRSKQQLYALRQRQLEEQRESVKALARQLELIKQGDGQDLEDDELSREISKLEGDKFSLAKKISDLESEYHSNLATLDALEKELEEVDQQDAEDQVTTTIDNATLLKLKFYRSLGVNLDSDDMNSVEKVLVKSRTGVHELKLENYSDSFISNFIWDRIGG